MKEDKPKEALALVQTNLGLYQMFAISEALDSMRVQERQQVI